MIHLILSAVGGYLNSWIYQVYLIGVLPVLSTVYLIGVLSLYLICIDIKYILQYYAEHEILHGFAFFALFSLHLLHFPLIYFSNTYFDIQVCLLNSVTLTHGH